TTETIKECLAARSQDELFTARAIATRRLKTTAEASCENQGGHVIPFPPRPRVPLPARSTQFNRENHHRHHRLLRHHASHHLRSSGARPRIGRAADPFARDRQAAACRERV